MTRDDLVAVIAAAIERARRANLNGDRAVADLILRDLKAAGVSIHGPKG